MIRRSLNNVSDPRTDASPFDALGLAAPSWTADALCAQVDPEIFFPDKGGSSSEAKAICAQCTVAAECLDYALEYESVSRSYRSYGPFGVYGGLSAKERRRLLKITAA